MAQDMGLQTADSRQVSRHPCVGGWVCASTCISLTDEMSVCADGSVRAHHICLLHCFQRMTKLVAPACNTCRHRLHLQVVHAPSFSLCFEAEDMSNNWPAAGHRIPKQMQQATSLSACGWLALSWT